MKKLIMIIVVCVSTVWLASDYISDTKTVDTTDVAPTVVSPT